MTQDFFAPPSVQKPISSSLPSWVVAPLLRAVAVAAAHAVRVRVVVAAVVGDAALLRPCARALGRVETATGAALVLVRVTADETGAGAVIVADARARRTAAVGTPSVSWCATCLPTRRPTSCVAPSRVVRATSWTCTSPKSTAPTAPAASPSSSSQTRAWVATSSSKWTARSSGAARSPCSSPSSTARVRRKCAVSSTCRPRDHPNARPAAAPTRVRALRRDAVPAQETSDRLLRVLHRLHVVLLRRLSARNPAQLAAPPRIMPRAMRPCLSELEGKLFIAASISPMRAVVGKVAASLQKR